MSDRVGELEVSGRLENAAREAERAGRLDRASELFERACLFDDAARCALQGGDLRRAALTAALGRDEGLLQRACEKLASAPEVARGVASTLAGRGDHRAAAMALAAAGDVREAAQAWAAARDPLRSARAWQQTGDVREAARVLEAAMRDDPDRQDVLAALGTLLAVGVMVLPAGIARFWARDVAGMMGVAELAAIVSGYAGLLVSFHTEAPAGPAIILVIAVFYAVSLALGRHGGVLRQLFPGRHLEA